MSGPPIGRRSASHRASRRLTSTAAPSAAPTHASSEAAEPRATARSASAVGATATTSPAGVTARPVTVIPVRPPPDIAVDAAAGPGDESTAGRLVVHARERAVVGPELLAFARELKSPETRAAYEQLAACLDRGALDDDDVARLTAFLELTLTTGRLLARHGQHAEDVVRRLYERTPRGATAAASAAALTEALRPMIGQSIVDLSVAQVRPGSYRVTLETDALRVVLALAPAGARAESVEVKL